MYTFRQTANLHIHRIVVSLIEIMLLPFIWIHSIPLYYKYILHSMCPQHVHVLIFKQMTCLRVCIMSCLYPYPCILALWCFFHFSFCFLFYSFCLVFNFSGNENNESFISLETSETRIFLNLQNFSRNFRVFLETSRIHMNLLDFVIVFLTLPKCFGVCWNKMKS